MSFTYVTSRMGVAITALYNLLVAQQATLNAAVPNGNVAIHDGPYALESEAAMSAVCVGWDGNDDIDTAPRYNAAEFHQQARQLGSSARFEQIEIQCAVIHYPGDPTPALARAAALNLLGAFEDVLRANQNLGIDGATGPCVITQGGMWQEPGDKGMRCRIVFTVHVPTFLQSTPY